MIIENKLKKPRISFGLGVLETTIKLGESILVYQNSLIKGDAKTENIIVTPITTGKQEIQYTLTNGFKSNKIILNVI